MKQLQDVGFRIKKNILFFCKLGPLFLRLELRIYNYYVYTYLVTLGLIVLIAPTFWNAYGGPAEVGPVQLLQGDLLQRHPLQLVQQQQVGGLQGHHAVGDVQPAAVGLRGNGGRGGERGRGVTGYYTRPMCAYVEVSNY